MIRQILCLIFILLLLGCKGSSSSDEVHSNSSEMVGLAGNRNLSDYDSGGDFSNCAQIPKITMQECVNKLARGREFILNHWAAKRRGFIVFHTATVDWHNDVHIFIEPDEVGNWRVVTRWKEASLPSNDEKRAEIIREKSAYAVKLVKNEDSNYYPFGESYLMLVDESGKEIERL